MGGDGHAVRGDYRAKNGTLSFAAGEMSKTISIEVLADGAYDGAVDEQFAIRLSGAVGADLLDGFTTAYVYIRDNDIAPSASPSVPPTPSPTPGPSLAPTSAPTQLPTTAPSVSAQPTPLPTTAPSLSQLPTSVPTAAPTFAPTSGPSFPPSAAPTPIPTPMPSIGCADGTSTYRLQLFDSGADGWNGATFSVRNSTDGTTIGETDDIAASGTLSAGSEGTSWLCLTDGCYELSLGGGTADNEISYEFVDEQGERFSGSSAMTDHFCVASGDVFAHPSAAPTVSDAPSPAPSSLPTPPPRSLRTPYGGFGVGAGVGGFTRVITSTQVPSHWRLCGCGVTSER